MWLEIKIPIRKPGKGNPYTIDGKWIPHFREKFLRVTVILCDNIDVMLRINWIHLFL